MSSAPTKKMVRFDNFAMEVVEFNFDPAPKIPPVYIEAFGRRYFFGRRPQAERFGGVASVRIKKHGDMFCSCVACLTVDIIGAVKSASGLDEINEAEAVDATHDLTLQAVADRRCGVALPQYSSITDLIKDNINDQHFITRSLSALMAQGPTDWDDACDVNDALASVATVL